MTRGGTTQTRTFAYDSNQRLSSVTTPESGTVTYVYNADGTVNKRTDAKGQELRYVYDAYGRVIEIRTHTTWVETSDYRVNLYYDTNPFITGFAQNTWGRLALAEYFLSPYRITEAYSYTASGRTQKKRLYENYAHSTSWPNRLEPPQSLDTIPNYLYLEAIYNYNNEGQVTSMTYPSSYEYPSQWENGRTYTYEFDSLGRPNKLTDNQATVWAKDVLYGPANEMKEMKYLQGFNGATPQYLQENSSFNTRLQRTQLQTVQSWNGVTLFNTQYVFSATQNSGQILQSVDAVSGETVD